MRVFVLPPSESWRSRVSLESLYGMCFDFPSTRAEITLPSAERERLIFVASFKRSPVAPVINKVKLLLFLQLLTICPCCLEFICLWSLSDKSIIREILEREILHIIQQKILLVNLALFTKYSHTLLIHRRSNDDFELQSIYL